MADSFTFTWEHKTRTKDGRRNPLAEMPAIKLGDLTPEVFGSMDTPDAYDVRFGDIWINGLNEQQAIMLLKKVRSLYMRELNAMQKEIDRLTLLDMPIDDPRGSVPWPRHYELRAKKERQR